MCTQMFVITKVMFLLLAFQLKHFLADYPLQGKFMLGKFAPNWRFVLPLASHCAVHALFTYLIALWFASAGVAAALAAFDFVCHFTMDRIKASPQLLGKFKALSVKDFRGVFDGANYSGTNGELLIYKKACHDLLKANKYFWWSLGLDQMVHHLTHYFIIWCLL